MIWSEAHNFLDSSEETKQLLSRVVDIDSFELPSDYYDKPQMDQSFYSF